MNRTLVAVTAVATIALCSACTAGTTVTGTTVPPCSADPTVTGCTASAGFSCTSGATPDQIDTSLTCSTGVEGGRGLTLFCCVQFQSSACGPDPTVQNCPGTSIGFSCTGAQTPEDTDPSLSCGPGVLSNAGALLYCCSL